MNVHARRTRGIAIVMVLLLLAGLIALATPFVISMMLHERSAASDVHAAQSRAGAEAAIDHGIATLVRRAQPKAQKFPILGPKDLAVRMDFNGNDLVVNLKDPSGLLWTAHIEDEQGKVNLNSAPPALLGNLLASSTLSEKAQQGDTVLLLDDKNAFPAGGDGDVSGFVFLGRDTPIPFIGCNGNELTLAQPLEHGFAKGTLVYDGRAYFITRYVLGPGSAKERPFRSIYELKSVTESLNIGGRKDLSSFPADEFARLEPLLTVSSGRDSAPWGHAERLYNQFIKPDEREERTFVVENPAGFSPGARVRVVQGGEPKEYKIVESVFVPPPQGQGNANQAAQKARVRTTEGLSTSMSGTGVGNDLFVEPHQAHPININTAPTEVLKACFIGIGLVGAEPVTRAKARIVAEQLAARMTIKGPILGPDDLRKAFEENGPNGNGTLNAAQVDALFINATEYHSPKLRTSTVPFVYTSLGAFNIEGTGIVGGETGVQLARTTLRQQVTLGIPPPSDRDTGPFYLHTQADWQTLGDRGLGGRVMTWPTALEPADKRMNVRTMRQPSTQDGGVRLAVGECGPHNIPGEFIDHCNNPSDPRYMQEGYKTNGGVYVLPGIAGANAFQAAQGVEMWYRRDSGESFYIFDQGEDDYRNRVSFFYDQGALHIRVYDMGLEAASSKAPEKYAATYSFPVTLNTGTWYHLAGSWRSSTDGGQEIRVDANPIPRDGPATFTPGCKLASDLSDTELNTIDLEDASDLPAAGAVQVGQEIIEYRAKKGNSLGTLSRGVRMSTVAEHREGEWVRPYGFVCTLAQDLRVGGGTLSDKLESAAKTVTTINKPLPPPNNVVKDIDLTIPCIDVSNFPQSGYVDINGEVIFYKTRTATDLQGCIRAQEGTGARDLPHGSQVRLCSLSITKHDDYDNDGYVQIDDETDATNVEWIRYAGKRTTNNNDFLISELNAIAGSKPPSKSIGNFRGQYGTNPNIGHAKKAKIIPVVRVNGPMLGSAVPHGTAASGAAPSPFGAGVSVVSVVTKGQREGELRWVKRAYYNQYPNFNNAGVFTDWGFDYLAGLNDFTTRRYPRNTGRFMKSPSGEMPDFYGAGRILCKDKHNDYAMSGYVDEVKVVPFVNSQGGKLAMDDKGLASGDTECYVETPLAWAAPNGAGNAFNPNWPQQGGVIRIGSELMYYDSASVTTLNYFADVLPTQKEKDARKPQPNNNNENKQVMYLKGLKRGILGTSAEWHEAGAGVMLFEAAPFTVLTGNVTEKSDNFSVKNGAGFAPEGYVWVNNEVISYTEHNGNNFTGAAPFRGRYGTAVATHNAGDIARFLPTRYWDRCPKDYDGPGLAFIQAGFYAENAVWLGFNLTVGNGNDNKAPETSVPRILVRVDGRPGWDSKGIVNNNDPTQLYEFPGSGNFTLRSGGGSLNGSSTKLGVRGDQIQIRVYWEYKAGAFQPSDDWKRTFEVQKLNAVFYSPFKLGRRDELERR